MKITPLQDRLLIKPILEEEKNIGLLIPDSAKEKPQKGKVIAVGEGKDDKPLVCKVDDVIFYRKGSGVKMPEGLLMMKEGVDVIAILVAEDRSTI